MWVYACGCKGLLKVLKAYIPCKCPLCMFSCMVVILSTYCTNSIFLYCYKCRWWKVKRFFEEAWDIDYFSRSLVCPHIFEDIVEPFLVFPLRNCIRLIFCCKGSCP